MNIIYRLVFYFCLIITVSCSSSKVTRTSESDVTDLSGRWNDTDALLVSKHMIHNLLDGTWHQVFYQINERKPRVRMGRIQNKTTEHIATDTFANDIELALLTSDDIELLAAEDAKAEIRREREDYRTHNLHPGGTRITKEKETDFILRGVIHSITDEIADTKAIYYQVDLELLSVADNEKIWVGQKRIKKLIEKPLVTW